MQSTSFSPASASLRSDRQVLWLGGAQWAGLEPELRRLHLTPDSLGLLLRKQGLEVTDVGTPFRNRAFRLMWQTVVNA